MLVEAGHAYEAAFRGYRDEGRDDDALRAQLRLATLLMLVGAHSEALNNVELALELKATPDARDAALMMKGEVLDALGDERALVAWTQCMQKIAAPMLRHICAAQLIGTILQRGELGAIAQLRTTLDKLPDLKREDRIDCVGAAGLSAGEHGT